jgi:CheY-like chemotaxis protein
MTDAHTHSVLVVAREGRGRSGLETLISWRRDVRVVASDSMLSALERMERERPCLVLADVDDRDVGGVLLRTLMLEAPELRDIPLAFMSMDGRATPAAGALHASTVRMPEDLPRLGQLLACRCVMRPPNDAA